MITELETGCRRPGNITCKRSSAKHIAESSCTKLWKFIHFELQPHQNSVTDSCEIFYC
jgi:hypothetical protein